MTANLRGGLCIGLRNLVDYIKYKVNRVKHEEEE